MLETPPHRNRRNGEVSKGHLADVHGQGEWEAHNPGELDQEVNLVDVREELSRGEDEADVTSHHGQDKDKVSSLDEGVEEFARFGNLEMSCFVDVWVATPKGHDAEEARVERV